MSCTEEFEICDDLSYAYIYLKYNFSTEQRVSSNLIGRAVPYTTLYKPLEAIYIKPKWLPVAGLQMFRMRKLRNLELVHFLIQRNMQLSILLKFLKVRQPLWTYLLVCSKSNSIDSWS